MLDYMFSLPTEVHFGSGKTKETGKYAKVLGATNVMIVADKGVINAGLTEAVEASLESASIPYTYYNKIVPNPRDYNVTEGYYVAKDANVDVLVAVGGGSSIDTAKAIGTLLTHGGIIQDWCGAGKLERKITPLIAIPTTAGTGSEVTPFAVITDSKTHVKLNIFDAKAAPRIALVDPTMLLAIPPHIMAATGIDAMTHAVEAYTCTLAVPHTDAYAIYAVKLIAENLADAVKNRSLDSCTGMMLGSTIAGIAFGYSDVAAVHCMAEALGGLYDLPHGVANAMLLPTVTEYNVTANLKKYADISNAMGLDTAGKCVEDVATMCAGGLQKLCKEVGIKAMKEYDEINPTDFHELSVAAMANVSTPSNPRKMMVKEYEKLFDKAYYGK
ncbi:MAG: iron-containing alcohol dehydrogenase [Anaerovorax sp.]|nr:iron-containing alcohol dehydrogenase [Anaerovorax sp.]